MHLLLAEKEWTGLVQGVLWVAVMLVMLAGAMKLTKHARRRGLGFLGIFTGREADDTLDAHDTLTKFRELHARGGLSDEEYRSIKTKLAPQLQGNPPPLAEAAPAEAAAPDFVESAELAPQEQTNKEE